MEIAKEKYDDVMAKYGQCSGGGIEKKTSEAFVDAVRQSVGGSQKYADAVVNLIGVRKTIIQGGEDRGKIEETPADYESAKEALMNLAKSVGPVAEHWRPFIESACDALQVDVSKVLPRGMVPDPAGLEKALAERDDQLSAEMKRNTDLELSVADTKKLLTAAQAARDELSKQLDTVAQQLDASKKAQADLAAENDALKVQLDKKKK